MPGLRSNDANALAHAALALSELEDLASFRTALPAQLRRLIDCEIASYNEIGPHPKDVFVAADPCESLELDGVFEAFATFALQNPLAAHYARTGDAQALRLSDFVSSRKFHALDLYDLVYRHIGTEYQLAFTVPAQGQLIGVTVSRDGSDFSERELAMLEAVRAIVVGAYRNLHDRARLEVIVRGLEQVEAGPYAVLLVEASGLLAPAHDRAARLLEGLSADHPAFEELRGWARFQRRLMGTSQPLTLTTEAGELEARYVRGSPGNLDAITLAQKPGRQPQALRVLGLTRRQADVVHEVWQGRTNAEIALALDISEHTVRRHLEGIYRRLDVSSRVAAAQLATRTLAGF